VRVKENAEVGSSSSAVGLLVWVGVVRLEWAESAAVFFSVVVVVVVCVSV